MDCEQTMLSHREVMAVRQREQYVQYDMQKEMIRMKTIIEFDMFSWTTLVNLAILMMGISATLRGEMTWGHFIAFQTYLKGIQGRVNNCFNLVIAYRKSIGVVSNLVDMLRTRIVLETHTRDEPFRTERPRFDEMPDTVGSKISQAVRNVLSGRQGYMQFKELNARRSLHEMGDSVVANVHPTPWRFEVDKVRASLTGVPRKAWARRCVRANR